MLKEEVPKDEKQDDLDELTYIISHDLQEPLRMITSYVQLLKKRYSDKLDDNAKEYIKYTVDGSNRLKQMMDDLLTYSRIGRPEIKREELDLEEIIEKVKKLLVSKYPSAANIIEFAADKRIRINADRYLFIKLIYNLVDNSMKFNHNINPKIKINLSEDKDNWNVSIKDNGMGIDKEYHGKIFGIFQKLHNHEEYSGSGIGLAMCEKIVSKHNGQIWLDSELEKGSTFHVSIKKGNKHNLIKILLIEDSPGDARLIKEYLSDLKNIEYTLQIADRLEKGIDILENEFIDVILLDLNLPDSKGLTGVEKIFNVAPNIPIIILTGLNDETTAINAVKMGAQDYLVKDKVESELLLRSIRYAIERKRAEEDHQKLLEQRIRALSIIEAQENERRRISRELHDGLGQLLSAAKLNFGMIDFVNCDSKENNTDIVKQVDSIISKAIVEARRIAHDLRPTTLDDFGLIPALRILCQEFSKITGVKVKFQVSPTLERIDPKVEIAIYRIIQESFNNISKYAESTEVSLDLYRCDTQVFVRVKDNGKGFDADNIIISKKAGGGFGLLNMKERAELIGGKVEIVSSPGQGTELMLEINLDFFSNNNHH